MPKNSSSKKLKKQVLSRDSLGIKEFDSMVEGGLPRESIVGLSGPPGVGKSIFSLHFLLEGARKGERVVYINLEEPRENIDNMINEFDFAEEFFDLEDKELIIIRCFEYTEYEKIYNELLDRIKEDKSIKRLVIDSFNCFFNAVSQNHASFNIRQTIIESFYKIRKSGLTALLILENEDHDGVGRYINYLVDGVIRLDFLDLGTIERRIFVPKMRWTNQFKESKGYEINKTGIEII